MPGSPKCIIIFYDEFRLLVLLKLIKLAGFVDLTAPSTFYIIHLLIGLLQSKNSSNFMVRSEKKTSYVVNKTADILYLLISGSQHRSRSN